MIVRSARMAHGHGCYSIRGLSIDPKETVFGDRALRNSSRGIVTRYTMLYETVLEAAMGPKLVLTEAFDKTDGGRYMHADDSFSRYYCLVLLKNRKLAKRGMSYADIEHSSATKPA